MIYKVINKPYGVTTREANSMKSLIDSINTNPYMVVAISKVTDNDEPYQVIQYNGKVQINSRNGHSFIEANTIASAFESMDGYTLLTRKPNNWNTKYFNYYEKINNEYVNVTGVEVTVYNPEFENDKYYKKEGDIYILLNSEPNDWGVGDYYVSEQITENEETITVYNKITFTSSNVTVAPNFEANKYYKEM